MSVVNELTAEIKAGLTQRSASQKDEGRVMKAMLNDREYVCGDICPAQEARDLLTTAIAATTKVTQAEAAQLAEGHEFKNSEAQNMINVSKSFVNTYLETGRKLPLGGTMNVALSQKHVEATQRPYPTRVGIDEQGNPIYGNGISQVPAHDTIRVHNPKL